KRQLLEEVQHICPKDVTIMHVRQGEAKGLGHAILCARPLIGDNPFAVLLPDVLIDDMASNLKRDNLAEMVHMFEGDQISQIMVEAVPDSEVDKYGIADIKGEALTEGMSLPMQAIVEKPPRDEAPSNLAVVGRYVLSANIWPLLERTPVGAGDEIQLTDAIAMLMEHEQVNAYFMKGRSHDCGSKMGFMKANVEYAVRHPELNGEFTAWLKQFVKQL
ncbi:MAG: UTP--glucose-1-phosphate uridylyltransferase, partial [Aeromonas salmonicida]